MASHSLVAQAIGRRRQRAARQVKEFCSLYDEDQQVLGKKYSASCRAVLRLPARKDGIALDKQTRSGGSRWDGGKTKKHDVPQR